METPKEYKEVVGTNKQLKQFISDLESQSTEGLSEEYKNGRLEIITGINVLIALLENKQVGIDVIECERRRQIIDLGYDSDHDDTHKNSQLAFAAAAYLLPSEYDGFVFRNDDGSAMGCLRSQLFPWGIENFKPSPDNRIKELTKAGALIAAEIDRLDRLKNVECEKHCGENHCGETEMKVFKFYCGEFYYAYAAQTKKEAVDKFTEDTGDQFTVCEEIPENEWDKKFIKVYEDNDFDKKPFKMSIRESITGTTPQQIYTTDLASF